MKYLLLLIFLITIGCADNRKDVLLLGESNILVNDDEIEVIIPDSIYTNVDYVKLETSRDAIIRGIDKIVIDDYIYILDQAQDEIFIFENDGSFVAKLNKRGQGPEEYISISDFFVQKEFLYILSPATQSIKVYNIKNDFAFTENISVHGYYYQFHIIGEYIYLYSDFSSEELRNIATYNIETHEIENRYQSFPSEQIGIGHRDFRVFFNWRDTLYSTFPYEYSIYKLSTNESEKIENFNFGKEHMYPLNLRKASSDDRKNYLINNTHDYWIVQDIENLIITNSSYVFSFNYLASNYTVIQNRKSGEAIWGYIIQTKSYPLATPFIHYYMDNKVIQIIDVEMIINAKNSPLGMNIPEDIANVDYDANPILGIYTLKEKYQ